MIVAVPSASNSVQSIATISCRDCRSRTGPNARQGINVDALLLNSRSTCLTACLVTKPRAWASAWPIVATANDAAASPPASPRPAKQARLACRSTQTACRGSCRLRQRKAADASSPWHRLPRYDMVVETRLDRTGVDAAANNIIRTARATAKFFPQTAPG